MSFCKDCVSGTVQLGEPQGKIEEINGVTTYIATPTVDYPKDKAVIVLTDVFGLPLTNNKLLADSFAANGFYTVVPDIFNGDSVPLSVLEGAEFKREEWAPNHGPAQTRPTIDKVISGLKDKGVKEFGATGYCFGARYVFDLAFENIIKVSVVSHPSMLEAPKDLQEYFDKSTAPLLINSCTHDDPFPFEKQEIADKIFGDGKFKPGYKREHFEGAKHGFAARGDRNDPKQKADMDGAFKNAVDWFLNYL
ncbi:dienelactone hydrolase endo-1,3,1,4-beta-D-glucanase [Flagelloscypha sp. PMI_526]|nr:dienelactone hydrolase endo-1,3,1,4-beta-D-glucanase [Flagelloscypha sp. PMI_526]